MGSKKMFLRQDVPSKLSFHFLTLMTDSLWEYRNNAFRMINGQHVSSERSVHKDMTDRT